MVADSTDLGYHQQRVDHYRRVERAVPAVFEERKRMIKQSFANKKVASACQRRPDKRVAGIVKPGDNRVDLGDSSEDSEATDVDSEASMWALSERSLRREVRREEAATNREIKRHSCISRKVPKDFSPDFDPEIEGLPMSPIQLDPKKQKKHHSRQQDAVRFRRFRSGPANC